MKLQLLFALVLFSSCLQAGTNKGFAENKGQIKNQNKEVNTAVAYSAGSGQLSYFLNNRGINYQVLAATYSTNEDEMRLRSKRNMHSLSSYTIARVEYHLQNITANIQWQASTEIGKDFYYTLAEQGRAKEVRTFEKVKAQNVYKGIDWLCYFEDANFKYDFIVAPGADYRQIKFQIKGAESIRITSDGKLEIKTALGILLEDCPIALQHNKTLQAEWRLENDVLSFYVPNYNPAEEFIIDPMVRYWGTYLGGSGDEFAYYSCTDNAGNLFVSGETTSLNNIATTGAYLQTYQGAGGNWGDAFVAKYDTQGNKLWCTYYGGSGDDWAGACSTDASGNLYFVGYTTCSVSAQITTSGAFQQNYGSTIADGDLFLVKFNPQGQRIWATYFGGESTEYGAALCLDNASNIYISGRTYSGIGIATAGVYQSALSGTEDGFIAKFTASGNLLWSTYFGGPGPAYESVNVLSVDGFGNLFFGGFTYNTSGIATPGSFQPNHAPISQTNSDGFFGKMNANGQLQWASYIGSTGTDFINDMHCDNTGGVYFCGQTTSSTSTLLASVGAFQTTFGGYNDGFVARFDGAGNRLWGSYFGAGGDDYFTGITLDLSGNPVLAGTTGSIVGNNLATNCTYQQQLGGGMEDALLVKFSPNGQRQWCTFYGGNQNDEGGHLAIDSNGNLFLVGMTRSTNSISIASASAMQSTFGGGNFDGFVVKFDGCIPGKFVNDIPLSNLLVCPGQPAVLTSSLNCFVDWYVDSLSAQPFASANSFTSGALNNDTTFYAKTFSCGANSVRAAIHVSMAAVPQISVSATPSTVCAGVWTFLQAQGAQSYSWSSGSTLATTWVNPTATSQYTIVATGANSCSVASLYQLTVSNCTSIEEMSQQKQELFPNPFSNYLQLIDVDNDITELVFIDIYGKTQAVVLPTVLNKRIDCTEFSGGVYSVLLKRNQEVLQVLKLIKE